MRSGMMNPYLMIMPSFVLAAMIILVPLVQVFAISISDVNRFGQILGFGGLENYLEVLTDDAFWHSLWRTLIWTAAIVIGALLVSIPLAIMLMEEFYGRGILRVIVMLPWAISLTMTAIIWRWALQGEMGMLNAALKGLGAIQENYQWFATGPVSFLLQIMIGILVSIPFTVTIMLGGLSSIPEELYEAARIEGANRYQALRDITLPLLRPFVQIAVVLNIIYVFNSFPIIWVTTQGGPAGSTDILVTYLYKLAFRLGKLGEASAVSVVMFLLLLLFTVLFVSITLKRFKP